MTTDPNTKPAADDLDLDKELVERFKQLPKVVQDAITSADVKKNMRSLAESHKLHVDQWGRLENEVMLTLLAFQEPADLATNIQSEVGVSAEEAVALAGDINKIVFEPIRQELERGLSHPEAKAVELTPEEAARQQVLRENAAPADANTPAVPGVLPATPPPQAPADKAVRAPISSSYTSRQASIERKSVDGDPYREPPA